jgi:hypothetical protein
MAILGRFPLDEAELGHASTTELPCLALPVGVKHQQVFILGFTDDAPPPTLLTATSGIIVPELRQLALLNMLDATTISECDRDNVFHWILLLVQRTWVLSSLHLYYIACGGLVNRDFSSM